MDIRSDFDRKHVDAQHSIDGLEQKFLLKILKMNARLLPHNFTPQILESERDFQVSFLLPMGPLSFEDVGDLSLEAGCAICGKDTANRCSQCHSIRYCGNGMHTCSFIFSNV